jgi:alpha-1,2-rhamnosyltransferase
MEHSGKFPAALSLEQWRWLSWREASAQLVQRIERNLNASLPTEEKQHAHSA